MEQCAGCRDVLSAVGVGKEPIVADAEVRRNSNRNCPESSVISVTRRVYAEKTVYNYPQLCYIIRDVLWKPLIRKDDADRQIKCPQGGDGEAG